MREAVKPGQDPENPTGDREAILAVFLDAAPLLPHVRPSQRGNFKREDLENDFKALTDDKKQPRYALFVCCRQTGAVAQKVDEVVGVILIGNSLIAQTKLETWGVGRAYLGTKLACMGILYTKPNHRGGEHSPAQLLLRKVETFAREKGFDGIWLSYYARRSFQREEGEEGGVLVNDPAKLAAYYERWGARHIFKADGTFAEIVGSPSGVYRTPVERPEEGLVVNQMVKMFERIDGGAGAAREKA